MRGLERRLEAGKGVLVESVASLFISRWDAAVHDKVPPEWRNRGEPRAVHQQGWEKQDKHQLRIDRDPLHTRHEGDGASADDQRGCWWQRQTPGQIVKPQHHQEHEDDQLEICRWMHRAAPFSARPVVLQAVPNRVNAIGQRIGPRPHSAWAVPGRLPSPRSPG